MLGSVQNLSSNKGPSIIQQQPQLAQPQQPQNGPSDIPPPPLNGQDFTLSNVLHFLQSEWRKYERDRNEWEIERAEMRVRRVFSTKCWSTFSFSFFLPGSHRSARGRASVLREYQSRPYAPYKNARVRSSGRAVCTSSLLSFVNVTCFTRAARNNSHNPHLSHPNRYPPQRLPLCSPLLRRTRRLAIRMVAVQVLHAVKVSLLSMHPFLFLFLIRPKTLPYPPKGVRMAPRPLVRRGRVRWQGRHHHLGGRTPMALPQLLP